MCQHKSGVVIFNSTTGDIRVLASDVSDSHGVIRREHHVRDADGLLDRYQTPVEAVPITDLRDIAGWEFRFDAGRPDWWQDSFTDRVLRHLFNATQRLWHDDMLAPVGDLNLCSLTSLPEQCELKPGGALNLGSLTSLPEQCELKPGGDLYLGSLTSLPEQCEIGATRVWHGGE